MIDQASKEPSDERPEGLTVDSSKWGAPVLHDLENRQPDDLSKEERKERVREYRVKFVGALLMIVPVIVLMASLDLRFVIPGIGGAIAIAVLLLLGSVGVNVDRWR